MDRDKFNDWQENNWEELTNQFAIKNEDMFHNWCIDEFNTLESQKEDLNEI